VEDRGRDKETRNDKTRQDKTRQDKTRQDKTRQCHDKARRWEIKAIATQDAARPETRTRFKTETMTKTKTQRQMARRWEDRTIEQHCDDNTRHGKTSAPTFTLVLFFASVKYCALKSYRMNM
jgi:hypothetical protein